MGLDLILILIILLGIQLADVTNPQIPRYAGMKKRGTTICCVICTTLCLLFLALAIVILVLNQIGFFKKEVDDYILEQLTLVEGHETYQQWLNPVIPMYKDFYVFNLTNPQEFKNGAKPHFKELGPYRYREKRVRTVLNHDHGEGTITYTFNRTFHFEQYQNFSEDDVITTINFVYVNALEAAAGKPDQLAALRFFTLFVVKPTPDVWINARAGDLFWNYTDPLLQTLYNIKQVPVPYVHLQYNNSINETTNASIIYSGETNSLLTGQFMQWAGEKTLHHWVGAADVVTGTEGIIWQPFLEQSQDIVAFVSYIQRNFHLTFSEKTSVLGIHVYKFRVATSEFQPNPDYHIPDSAPNGLINLGVLQTPPASVWGSRAHFFDCDQSVRDAVEGIDEPDQERDEIFADIEPITGCTLNGHQRLQVNVNVTKSSLLFPFHSIRTPVYFPMFYVDEWATIDESLKAQLERMVFTPLTAIDVSIWVAFGLCGFFSLLFGMIAINRAVKLYQFYRHRRQMNIPLPDQSSDR